MSFIKKTTLCLFITLMCLGTQVFADRMSVEQIKREYIFVFFPGIIILNECYDDPMTPTSQRLCRNTEEALWWKFYALLDIQTLKTVLDNFGHSEEQYAGDIEVKGFDISDYDGGCARVKIEVMKPAYETGYYDLPEVVKDIWITHILPFENGCLEGNLDDYGAVGNDMEIAR